MKNHRLIIIIGLISLCAMVYVGNRYLHQYKEQQEMNQFFDLDNQGNKKHG